MKKSQLAGFLLTLLFGPLGLFYSSVGSALFFIILAIIIVPLTAGYAAIIFWLLSVLWGFVCVSSYNSKVAKHEINTIRKAQQAISPEGQIQTVTEKHRYSGFWLLLILAILFFGYNIAVNNL